MKSIEREARCEELGSVVIPSSYDPDGVFGRDVEIDAGVCVVACVDAVYKI